MAMDGITWIILLYYQLLRANLRTKGQTSTEFDQKTKKIAAGELQ
jgi:hypothetical protein